jgi:hypothetical protein
MNLGSTNVLDAQRQYLDALKWGQKAVTEAVEFWSGAYEGSTLGSGLPQSADWLPAPAELVEGAFAFLESLIAGQKELALAFVEAAAAEWA